MSHIIAQITDFGSKQAIIDYLNGCSIDFNKDNGSMLYSHLVDIAHYNDVPYSVIDDLYARSERHTAIHSEDWNEAILAEKLVTIIMDLNKSLKFDTVVKSIKVIFSKLEKEFNMSISSLLNREKFEKVNIKFNELNWIDRMKLSSKDTVFLFFFLTEKLFGSKKPDIEEIPKTDEVLTKEKADEIKRNAVDAQIVEEPKPTQQAKVEAPLVVVQEEDDKLDVNDILPKEIKADLMNDILDKIQIENTYIPWHVARATAAGILASLNLVNVTDVINDITNKNFETGQNMSDAYFEIVNSITSQFSELGPLFASMPSTTVEECISKANLLKIATRIAELAVDNTDQVNALIDKIKAYEYKTATTNNGEPISPVIFNNTKLNLDNTEIVESQRKQVYDAFGKLLTNKPHTLKKFGELIELSLTDILINNQPASLLIDPNIIIGDGYNIIAASPMGGTTAFNIARNRDIVKKLLVNPTYVMTAEEYQKSRKGQFVNDELYSVVDMTGMSKHMGQLSKDNKSSLENRLLKIFTTPNPFFASFGIIPRFRFSIFKNINEFTLVSDDKVKVPLPTLNNVVPGCTIMVTKDSYTIFYNNQTAQLKF